MKYNTAELPSNNVFLFGYFFFFSPFFLVLLGKLVPGESIACVYECVRINWIRLSIIK